MKVEAKVKLKVKKILKKLRKAGILILKKKKKVIRIKINNIF